MRSFNLLLVVVYAAVSVLAHPINREIRIVGRSESVTVTTGAAAAGNGLEILSNGNKAFRDELAKSNPDLLQKLADEGQAPPFMFIGCSDSRVSEGTVFKALPGTLFTQRNIANQFQSNDPNAQSVLSYAVSELGVSHVIVMGHYGCGGVAASIASAPSSNIDAASGSVQSWIQPIREIFNTSNRTEIVELRNKNAALAVVEEPEIREPGFRALVEENVKASVRRIATDSVLTNHFARLAAEASNSTAKRSSEGGPAQDVFVHGFVYDIETGIVQDLGITVGPPGKALPATPFAAVAKAATETAKAHGSSEPAKAGSPSESAKASAPSESAKASAPVEVKTEAAPIKVIGMSTPGKRSCVTFACKARRSIAEMLTM